MPATKLELKIVLCATLTADGKLDTATPAVPPVLHTGDSDPARHPWGALYDEAAGVLVSKPIQAALPMPQAAIRPVVAFREDAMSSDELAAGLQRLTTEGIRGYLLCFGDSLLFRALLEAGLVDELRLIVRPAIDGRRGSPSLSGVGGPFLPASVACRLVSVQTHGDECLLHYRIRRPARPHRRPRAA